MAEQQQNINIKVTDEVLKGSYSNLMFVSHTKEEFILDFVNVFGPQGMEVAKIITSPGHLKRIAAALNDNLKKYQSQFGEIKEEQAQAGQAAKDSTSSQSFGFN